MSHRQQKQKHLVSEVVRYLDNFCWIYPDNIPGNKLTNRQEFYKSKPEIDSLMTKIRKLVKEIIGMTLDKHKQVLFNDINVNHDFGLLDKARLSNFILLEKPLCTCLCNIANSPEYYEGKIKGFQIGQKFLSIQLHPNITEWMTRLLEISDALRLCYEELRKIVPKFSMCYHDRECRNLRNKQCPYLHSLQSSVPSDEKSETKISDFSWFRYFPRHQKTELLVPFGVKTDQTVQMVHFDDEQTEHCCEKSEQIELSKLQPNANHDSIEVAIAK